MAKVSSIWCVLQDGKFYCPAQGYRDAAAMARGMLGEAAGRNAYTVGTAGVTKPTPHKRRPSNRNLGHHIDMAEVRKATRLRRQHPRQQVVA